MYIIVVILSSYIAKFNVKDSIEDDHSNNNNKRYLIFVCFVYIVHN